MYLSQMLLLAMYQQQDDRGPGSLKAALTWRKASTARRVSKLLLVYPIRVCLSACCIVMERVSLPGLGLSSDMG